MADVHADKNQDEWNEETVYGPSTVIAALDQIEDLVTRVFSDRIAEKAAEQPDVLTQRFGEGSPLVVNGDQIIDGRRWTPGRGTVGRSG